MEMLRVSGHVARTDKYWNCPKALPSRGGNPLRTKHKNQISRLFNGQPNMFDNKTLDGSSLFTIAFRFGSIISWHNMSLQSIGYPGPTTSPISWDI